MERHKQLDEEETESSSGGLDEDEFALFDLVSLLYKGKSCGRVFVELTCNAIKRGRAELTSQSLNHDSRGGPGRDTLRQLDGLLRLGQRVLGKAPSSSVRLNPHASAPLLLIDEQDTTHRDPIPDTEPVGRLIDTFPQRDDRSRRLVSEDVRHRELVHASACRG
jgi:hypothetical protein